MEKTFSIFWNQNFQSRVLIAKKNHVLDMMIIETLRFGNDVELNSLEDVVKELVKNGYEEEKRVNEWIKKN